MDINRKLYLPFLAFANVAKKSRNRDIKLSIPIKLDGNYFRINGLTFPCNIFHHRALMLCHNDNDNNITFRLLTMQTYVESE